MSKSLFRKKSLDTILKDPHQETDHGHGGQGLKKVLTVKDLTSMGIAAVVGAGIFSTIGTAAFNGGPGISLLFIITAITCGFSALCYAEFASRVPIAGSAYTYAYVSFGELIAWIIGWALILEYAIGNIVVAISWSGYFNNLLEGFGVHLPAWLTTDPTTAKNAYAEVEAALRDGKVLDKSLLFAQEAWHSAPVIAGKHIFINVPAFVVVVLISILTFIGIKESKKTTNFLVIFKILVILFVIVVGFFFVNPGNWSPFLPNGFEGVLKGVSAVFYAYIGFDAISTTAEECKNPQRDLPRGMIYSLVICTVLYILITLVLTGMVPFTSLKVADPLAYVFELVGQDWISYIISISAVVATTSVLLVFQLGQPRIWMSMSRDGLLPQKFSKIHPKFQTPSFSTLMTGIIVAIPSLFMEIGLMTDLTSIGTLFAFVLVSGGVLTLPKVVNLKGEVQEGKFKLPYINGRFIIPILYAVFMFFMLDRVQAGLTNLTNEGLQEILFLLFVLLATTLTIATVVKQFNVIPILGVLFCAYLLIEIPALSWIYFFVWMGIGLIVYFAYGYWKSRLAK
ncbi:amino acid permease [Pseudochryseolinea flava]|uniref:Amino acid transporter n=1 Tax=Pseudochryseolinea flava TaxID=2059302 RepID=A0A364XXG1_9BACT|nr:amino acid permease [Pseudochryseolinea flava]RAV99086.1 amino acid transporter [Pseudochryseolinea flava]